jgi:DNA-binding CsgD family transcriptional regulator
MSETHPLYGQPLGDREEQIIRLAGSGMTNAEIGQILFISPNTVKSFLHRASLKTGLHSKTALVVWLLAKDVKAEAFDLDSTLHQFRRYGWQE